MSEAKFTEGPWLSMVMHDDDAMMSFYGVGIGKSFLSVSTCKNNSKHDADLIATAPEMYALLEMISKILNGDDPINEVTTSDIEKLLAKSRGER